MNIKSLYRPIVRPIRQLSRNLRGKPSGSGGRLLDIQYLLHRDVRHLKAVPGIVLSEATDDRAMTERIVAAFRKPSGDSSQPTDVWDRIYNAHQRAVVETLSGGSLDEVARLLKDPRDANLFVGFDGIFPGVIRIDPSSAEQVNGAALVAHDHAICAAEVMGAVTCENPQAGPKAAKYGFQPTDDFLDAMEAFIGAPLAFPNSFPGEVGVQTRRGVVSPRAVHAIYQAWRIRELVKGISHPRILEIGGGMGRTAFYARALGIRDYTIVDLPLASVAQALFLSRAIGDEHVVLHGEEANETADVVKLYRPEAFLQSDKRYDLIVNVDSITEIGLEAALEYWEKIKTSTPLYVSANHEINPFTMAGIARDHPEGVLRSQRHPYGLRRGYVEELFEFL